MVVLYLFYVFNKEETLMATKAANAKKSVKSIRVSRASLSRVGSPLKESAFIGSLLAEVLGTFLLAGMFIISQGQPIILLFTLIGVVMLVGNISGAHLNPAISLGAWVTRRMSALKAIAYVVAQFAGAALAFGLLNYFISGAGTPSADAAAYAPQLYKTSPIPAGKEWYITLAEGLGLIILGFGYAKAMSNKRDLAGGAATVGLALFIALFLAATATSYLGGSAVLNPAIAMTVQALKVELWPFVAYAVAPVIGAIIGFALYDILGRNNES